MRLLCAISLILSFLGVTYDYTPSGELSLLTADTLVEGSYEVVAQNQCLFADPTGTPAGTKVLTPGASGFYLNRSRIYSPSLGRPFQPDPNATALPMVTSYLMSGQQPGLDFMSYDLQGHYGDGLNPYAYLAGNPINNRDPLGLDMWDDEIDDLSAEITGNKIYALGAINEGAKWARIGLTTAMDITASILGLDTVASAWKIATGKGTLWDALDVLTSVVPIAKLGAKAFGSLGSVNKAFATLGRACNCFIAGTLVATPEGLIPIESIRVGDLVMTRHEQLPFDEPSIGRVTSIFRDLAPTIVWVTLSNTSALGTTLDHEVWTCQAGWTTAGQLEPGDELLDSEGLPVEVLDVYHDPTPTTVYNLEVSGSFTYFAERVWVHNNSCRVGKSVLGDALRHVNKILPYKAAQKLTATFNHKISAHHILEQRHFKNWGRQSEIANAPAVILTKDMHDSVTAALRTELPYGTKYTPHQVWTAYQKVYHQLGAGEWLAHIEHYFR